MQTIHEYLNENTGDNDWTQPDKKLGNLHLELMRTRLTCDKMQQSINKAIYKLTNLSPTNTNFNKQIDDIIDILEGFDSAN